MGLDVYADLEVALEAARAQGMDDGALASSLKQVVGGAALPDLSPASQDLLLRLAWFFFIRAPAVRQETLALIPMVLEVVIGGQETLTGLLRLVQELEETAAHSDEVATLSLAYTRRARDPDRILRLSGAALEREVREALAEVRADEAAFREGVEGAARGLSALLQLGEEAAAPPDEVPVAQRLDRARRLVAAGRAEAALETLAEAVSLAGEPGAEALALRSEAYLRLGDAARAMADLDAGLARSLTPAMEVRLRVNRGALRLHQGDLAGAHDDIERAARLEPESPSIWYNRGYLLSVQGDPQGAYAAYTECLKRDQRFAQAWMNRGTLLAENGALEAAIHDYTQALSLQPTLTQAWVSRALARFNAGDTTGAIEDYSQAIDRAPDSVEALLGRGIAQGALGQWKAALYDLDAAVELRPDADTYYNRANVLAAMGKADDAEADYAAAIQYNPQDWPSLVNRGVLRMRRGAADDAIEDFTAALALHPGHHLIHLRRGLALANVGQLDAAEADLQASLSLAPPEWEERADIEGILASLQASHPRNLDLTPST